MRFVKCLFFRLFLKLFNVSEDPDVTRIINKFQQHREVSPQERFEIAELVRYVKDMGQWQHLDSFKIYRWKYHNKQTASIDWIS